MGLVFNLLTLPVLGGPRLVHWLARTVVEQAERQSLDEASIRAELLELDQRYQLGEIGQDEYEQGAISLLERLAATWQIKKGRR